MSEDAMKECLRSVEMTDDFLGDMDAALTARILSDLPNEAHMISTLAEIARLLHARLAAAERRLGLLNDPK